MKIHVKGVAYAVDLDWTFREEETARRVTSAFSGGVGLGYGEVLEAASKADGRGAIALATVAYLRAGKNPDELIDDELKLSDLTIDYSDDTEAAGPLAGGAAAAPASDEPPGQES